MKIDGNLLQSNINNLPIDTKEELHEFTKYIFGGENEPFAKGFNISYSNWLTIKGIDKVEKLDDNCLKYENVFGIIYFIKNAT